jgi:hypothetical protein
VTLPDGSIYDNVFMQNMRMSWGRITEIHTLEDNVVLENAANVRATWRGLPLTGSGPAKARSCQWPGVRSRIVPGRLALLVLAMSLKLLFVGP